MPEPANPFGVGDIPLLVARSIRDRLRVLQEIDEADVPMKTVNKHTARERLELIHLGIQLYLAVLGISGSKHR